VTVFLLSPARSDGERARMLTREGAAFPLARALRERGGAPLGEVFSFCSGLYFRGKLAYARAFALPPPGVDDGALVITAGRGLWPARRPITLDELRAFGEVDIASRDERYLAPLRRDVRALMKRTSGGGRVVLLGSIASDRYVAALVEVLGERLLFPTDFVGRGDMSRGGLLLRAARAGVELPYAPVVGATRHGPRPPKLPRLPRR
jgi:hypothetical protein